MSIETCLIEVSGIVQGIGYRPFVYNLATSIGIKGTVQNLGDAGVRIIAVGTRDKVNLFIEKLKSNKPKLCVYDSFIVKWNVKQSTLPQKFEIIKSSNEKLGAGFSYLPPDIAICDQCVNELLHSNDIRRKDYPFNSCVDCGPRFTVIDKLPYDRPNTVMRDFPFCDECLNDYLSPDDRRFHAQTTCCHYCGPKYLLYDKNGDELPYSNHSEIVKFVAQQIEEGKIVAIKGIGGTHIACSTKNDKVLLRLREVKGKRKYKPFAIMAKDIESILSFAHVNEKEKELLESFRRPIVLLDKSSDYDLSEWVSPKLHNIGVMLPYAGIHYMLFEYLKDSTIVMTSANPSNYPMFIENDEIISKLPYVDFFLLHNRTIYQRCDDSVLRINNIDNKYSIKFLRRSRGWVPEPLIAHVDIGNKTLLAVGGEMHLIPSLMKGNRIIPTQYIGTVTLMETFDFMLNAIKHFTDLYQVKIDSIAYDLHPQYMTSTSINEISDFFGANSYTAFQHHKAHIASVALEHQIDPEEEILGLAIDGTGYGDDKSIWGGEIFGGKIYSLERLAHNERFYLPGGDLAVKYPLRTLLSFLVKNYTDDEIFNILPQISLQHTSEESIRFVLAQLRSKKLPSTFITSSTGRFLDAVSVFLNLCAEQTFEGEPAIKLESHAYNVKEKEPCIDFQWKGDELNLSNIFPQINEYKKSFSTHAIASAVQKALGRSYGLRLNEYAEERGVDKVLISGGVSFNQIITKNIVKEIDTKRISVFFNEKVSPGDGGISVGQLYLLSLRYLI